VFQAVWEQLPGNISPKWSRLGFASGPRCLEGVSLPRTIGFTAALDSVGLPQEILGSNASDSRDLDSVRETYIHFDEDMRDSMRFLNPESLSLLPSNLQEPLKMLEIEYDVDERHNEISSHILRNIQIEVVHWNRVGGVAGSTP